MDKEVRTMRGPPAKNLRDEAKNLALRMGYNWTDNTDPAKPFTGFMYNGHVMVAVTAKKIRYGLPDNCIVEKEFPDDIMNIRDLLLPPYVLRELWVRTQNERAYRRFYILPGTTAEIEENTYEHYRNTHYREAYWKKAPYRIELLRRKEEGEEGGRDP
jgi:hypothetical protein